MAETARETMLVTMLHHHLTPSLAMLREVIKTCPDSLWSDTEPDRAMWKRVLHALESLDFFLNEFGSYRFDAIGKGVSPEYNAIDTRIMSRNEITGYFDAVREKLDKAIAGLTDQELLERSNALPHYTVFELFLVQFRHLSLSTGISHGRIISCGGKAPGWIGYREQPSA